MSHALLLPRRPRRTSQLPGYTVTDAPRPRARGRADVVAVLPQRGGFEVRLAVVHDADGDMPPLLSVRRFVDGVPGPRIEFRAEDLPELEKALAAYRTAFGRWREEP